ncbi:MAG: GNAT family N-acetyltransferase [Nitrospirae bacterium]|nr:GNAT family N-acetyltransferase [Nitrospirota bacterium]
MGIDKYFKYERFYLDELSLEGNREMFPPVLARMQERLRRRFQIEWLTKDSSDNLQSYLLYRRDIPEQKIRMWLNNGCTTVVALEKGEVIGDCWLGIDFMPFPAQAVAEMLREQGYAYSFKAYVVPRYRSLGIFPLLIDEQVKYLRMKGMKALFAAVSPDNKVSRQSGKNMGFKRIYTLHLLNIMGRDYAKITR